MTNREMEMDAWREQMFEMRANGMQTYSFAEWKRRQEAMRVLFDRHIQREIDLSRGK